MARAMTASGAKATTNRATAKPKRAGDRGTVKDTIPAARRPGAPGVTKPVAAVAPMPKLSKDELRAQVDKLGRANANLRSRNRELKRAIAEASDRIAALEAELGRNEGQVAAAAPAGARKEPGRRTARRGRDRDPGDAVPPGVAVQEPAPLSDADRKVLEQLNEALSPE